MSNFEALIARGTREDQPAAGHPGRLYYVTDEAVLERDNGVTWDTMEGAGAAGYTPGSGWLAGDGTWSYTSADAPTFVIGTTEDLTDVIGVGDRIKITQATGGTKYFIVTAITSSTITVYGGTDYTLNNEDISTPLYSHMKAPFGFPVNPDKWTVGTSYSSDQSQTATGSTWYNLGSVSLSVPIGAWRVQWHAHVHATRSGAGIVVKGTLSTANNSESDAELTGEMIVTGGSGNLIGGILAGGKNLLLAAKTSYYLNEMAVQTTAASGLVLGGSSYSPAYIKAVCAYL